MNQRLQILSASCFLAIGCPQISVFDAGTVPPDVIDAGADGGGDADGGFRDAGSTGGEGEGECMPTGDLTVQPDDAGSIRYETCLNADRLFGACTDGSCADSETERQLIDLILEVASIRGYGDRIEIVDVHDDLPDQVVAWIAVVADWSRASGSVSASINDVGQVTRESVEIELPLTVPSALPSVEEVQDQLRACAPDLLVSFCRFWVCGWPCSGNALLGGTGGFEAATCVGADLRLWDPVSLDAGPPAVTCYSNGLPCCE